MKNHNNTVPAPEPQKSVPQSEPAGAAQPRRTYAWAAVLFVVLSITGVVCFMVNVTINGVTTVPLEHLNNLAFSLLGPIIPYYTLCMVFLGVILPIKRKTWNQSLYDIIFTVAKALGCVIGVMAVFHVGPEFLHQPDYIPFLWDSIVVPIAVLIPLCGPAFIFMIQYGLVEFAATFMNKIMRVLFKTPGASAVDALVSFSDGYAMAVIVTNDMYKKGIYTRKEAAIIATGFSTVSISFLMIIADTLGFMDKWGVFLLSCFVITFAVTAITARIYPLSKIPNTYYDKPAPEPPAETGNIFVRAFRNGVTAAQNTKPFTTHMKEYYLGAATEMGSAVTASILSVGLIGILIANFTPLFDWAAWLFYPFTALLRLPDAFLAAKACAIEIAEMFLPSLLVVGSSMVTKFTVAVTSVSAILFFSASIPSLLSTDIPVSMKDILIVWFERTILSLILAAGVGYLIF